MKKTTIYDCCIQELPKIFNRAGNITPLEGKINIPFNIARLFYIYDIPGGESRGAHAHKECHQFFIAVSGSFDVFVDDGINKKTVSLNRPNYGFHVPPLIWAHELNFSSGSICLVLTSHIYNKNDYLRDYKQFIEYKNRQAYLP